MYTLLKALQYIFCFYQLSDLIQFQIKFHFHLMSARNANARVWDCDVIEFGGQHPVGWSQSVGQRLWVALHMNIWSNLAWLFRKRNIVISVYCKHRSGFLMPVEEIMWERKTSWIEFGSKIQVLLYGISCCVLHTSCCRECDRQWNQEKVSAKKDKDESERREGFGRMEY